MLSEDITTTKVILTEAMDRICHEHQDPKKEFEAWVLKLESQMEKLNQDWKLEHGLPKKELQQNSESKYLTKQDLFK